MQQYNTVRSQKYYVNGKPDINPFRGIIANDPMNQGALRHFHSLPTKPYDANRKLMTKRQSNYFENPNNVFTPIDHNDIKNSFVRTNIHNNVLLTKGGPGLPTDISNKLPFKPSDKLDKRKFGAVSNIAEHKHEMRTKRKSGARINMMVHPKTLEEVFNPKHAIRVS